ncbi:MAG TPA: enoyl-CoA hydratase/isomerase family protein [Thermoanaerobaculia bacterium]|nr:enoyl-CoA hydratase/isomerase family protein [Thermoanaerobaculia bacterium]
MTDTLVRVTDQDGVRVLALARGKANALDLELVSSLADAARRAEGDDAVRGLVLTSASPSIFCGGFDLVLLGHADAETLGRFLRTFETLFFDLFLLKKPLVAALTGHAIAGGAILAGAADFRFASEGSGTLGLPEARLGVPVPRACLEAMRVTFGDRALTRLALGGDPLSFAEAKELGAIDSIVGKERLVEEAALWARRLGEAPPSVYGAIKRDLRSAAYERARAVLVEGREAFADSWFSDAGQRGISAALARLK